MLHHTDIAIVKHHDLVTGPNGFGLWLNYLSDGHAYEFRISTIGDAGLHRRAMNLVRAQKAVWVSEHFEEEDANEIMDEIFADSGYLRTTLDDGMIVMVTPGFFSVFLPVEDFSDDEETYWVAAVPVLRELIAH